MSKPLAGKHALITGASRGIGAAAAVALAGAGAHVILLARTVGGLEAVDDQIRAAGGHATLMPLDMLRLSDVDKLGPAVAERFGGLDILVGNAGMLGTLGPLPHATARDWDEVMAVNVTANFRLIRTFDPLLRASAAGRVVMVSSGLAQMPLAYWGAYCTSKAALEMMVRVYAAETEKTAIRANLLDPGIVDTAMLKSAFPGGFPGEARSPESVVPAILDLVSDSCAHHGQVIKA